MKKKEVLGVRVTSKLRELLEEYATVHERSISWVINKAIREFIQKSAKTT